MFSGSQNPDEQNDWLAKQQREQERQRKALEKQQQALNKPASGFTAVPTGMTPANEPETSLPRIEPVKIEPVKPERQEAALPDFTRHWDDPLDKLPSGHVNFHLENKYSGRAGPWDWAGRPFPRHEAEPMIANRKATLKEMSQDMRDVLFLTNYQNDATFRERANRAIHELSRIMPELKAGKAFSESASEPALSKVSPLSGQATNLPASQKRSGLSDVLSVKPAASSRAVAADSTSGQLSASPAKPAASSGTTATGATAAPEQTDHSLANSLQTTAHVNDPHDQGMGPLLQGIADFFGNTLGENSRIHGRYTVGPSDESMGPAYRAAGEAVREAARKNFVEPSAVNAQGTYPPGHLDESMAELEKAGFEAGKHQAVADTHELIGEKEGFTYEPDIGTVEADAFGVGIKMVPLQIESAILSLGATFGRFLFDLFGGDPIGLEKTEARVQALEKTLEAMKPVKVNHIYVKDHPEETGRNLTRYLYQQFGNQLIKLPATWLLANAQSIAALTGVSASLLTAQINAGIIREKGKGDPYTSAMYGVPLGLLVLMKVPFRVPFSIENAREFGKYLGSVLVDFGVEQVQQAGARFAVDNGENKYKKERNSAQ